MNMDENKLTSPNLENMQEENLEITERIATQEAQR